MNIYRKQTQAKCQISNSKSPQHQKQMHPCCKSKNKKESNNSKQLIKDHRTINNRLNGGNIGLEKEYCSILTKKEEESLVRFCKNKSEACSL